MAEGKDTFKEMLGNPAIEHKKKRLLEEKVVRKEQEKKKSLGKQYKFYTVQNNKILLVSVKENGAHFSYIGKLTKRTKDDKVVSHKDFIVKMKKEGKFVMDHELDAKCSELMESLNGKTSKKEEVE